MVKSLERNRTAAPNKIDVKIDVKIDAEAAKYAVMDAIESLERLEAAEDVRKLKLDAEKAALIRLLRDETQSREVHDRCVAIVGPRTPDSA